MNAKQDQDRARFFIKKTFESFDIPAFRIFFGSLSGQWLAFGMLTIVNSLLIYRLTGSAFLIGVMALAQYIPVIFLALIGGAVADRIQKKYIILVGRIGTIVSSLIVAVALSTGYLAPENLGSWWVLILSSFINGVVSGLIQPATMSIVPEIVGTERVMNAISLTALGSTIFRFIGPTLAGVLIDNYGFDIVFYLITCVNVIAAVITGFLPRGTAGVASGRSTIQNIVDGLKYARRETIFLLIVIFGLLHTIAGMPFLQLTPVFTETILKVNATMLGVLNSMLSVGTLVTSLVFASLPGRRRGVILLLSGIVMGLAVLIFAYSRSWYLSLGMVILSGIGMAVHMTLTSTLIQSYAEPGYRARMQSLSSLGMGFSGFGVFFAGALSDAVGLELAVGGMGVFLLIATIVMWAIPTRLRKLE